MNPAAIKPLIKLDVLNQIDVRAGAILSVKEVAGSDNLMELRVDFGDHQRSVIAGIRKERENPREIEGKQALFVVNLERAKCAEWSRKRCSSILATQTAYGRCWPCLKIQCQMEREPASCWYPSSLRRRLT